MWITLCIGLAVSLIHEVITADVFAAVQVIMPDGVQFVVAGGRLQLKCDGIRCRTGGDVKGKLANGVGNQYRSHYHGTWCMQHYYR